MNRAPRNKVSSRAPVSGRPRSNLFFKPLIFLSVWTAFISILFLLYLFPDAVGFMSIGQKSKPLATERAKLPMLSKEHGERIQLATDICLSSRRPNRLPLRVAFDRMGRAAICIIPQAGFTFWMSIFRFLNNDTVNVYKSPFDIPKWEVYHTRNKSVIRIKKTANLIAGTIRFMFAMDPYHRLWFVWIDKIWLLDFWPKWASIIITYLPSDPKYRGHNETRLKEENISFEDFLRYVTRDGAFFLPRLENDHWRPMTQLCDPCTWYPHVIGKMETFREDVNFILDSTNLAWLLKLPRDKEYDVNAGGDIPLDNPVQDIRIQTEYYWKLLERYADCEDLFNRLWTAFQYKGYLPASQQFPVGLFFNCNAPGTVNSFIAYCQSIHKLWARDDKSVVKRQRERLMTAAYRQVPTEVMVKVVTLFKDDFELFGYESMPRNVFRKSQIM